MADEHLSLVAKRGALARRQNGTTIEYVTHEQYRQMLELAYDKVREGLQEDYRDKYLGGMRDAALFRLMWETGARIDDVLDLRYSDFDTANMTLTYRIKKVIRKKREKQEDGSFAVRTIHPPDYRGTNTIPIMDRTLPVFLHNFGKKGGMIGENDEIIEDHIFAIRRRRAWQVVHEYGQRIGIECHPHMFRHGLAMHIYFESARLGRTGIDAMPLIKERLGHSDVVTTMRFYLTVTPEMQRSALTEIMKDED